MPSGTDSAGVMNPQAGVTTTRPATAPEQKPSTLGFLRMMYSSAAQVNEATAVASVVVVKALAARPPAAPAEPALKPYQPTQSMPVPTMQSTIECGGIGSLPKPSRFRRMIQSTRALQPELICTTGPPAKSSPLRAASLFSEPHMKPTPDQTMWASG